MALLQSKASNISYGEATLYLVYRAARCVWGKNKHGSSSSLVAERTGRLSDVLFIIEGIQNVKDYQ